MKQFSFKSGHPQDAWTPIQLQACCYRNTLGYTLEMCIHILTGQELLRE